MRGRDITAPNPKVAENVNKNPRFLVFRSHVALPSSSAELQCVVELDSLSNMSNFPKLIPAFTAQVKFPSAAPDPGP
jgi:hypothetical protein